MNAHAKGIMSHGKTKHSRHPKLIDRKNDERISCYSRSKYTLEFKAKALGWFVQFATPTPSAVIDRSALEEA
jgi:hypothetical protein